MKDDDVDGQSSLVRNLMRKKEKFIAIAIGQLRAIEPIWSSSRDHHPACRPQASCIDFVDDGDSGIRYLSDMVRSRDGVAHKASFE